MLFFLKIAAGAGAAWALQRALTIAGITYDVISIDIIDALLFFSSLWLNSRPRTVRFKKKKRVKRTLYKKSI